MTRTSFIDAVLSAPPSLIAEIKPRSPSKGPLIRRGDIPRFISVYNQHAKAISVLCDRDRFGGGYDLLAEVRAMTSLPLLAKDFIRSTQQIDTAEAAGADAVLLIVKDLTTDEISSLVMHVVSSGLDVLLEVHAEDDVRKVTALFPSLPWEVQRRVLVGINNRDLVSLNIDLATTDRLAPIVRTIPMLRGVIAESGIRSPADIQRLRPHVDGFLIGTSILQSPHPASFITSLFPTE